MVGCCLRIASCGQRSSTVSEQKDTQLLQQGFIHQVWWGYVTFSKNPLAGCAILLAGYDGKVASDCPQAGEDLQGKKENVWITWTWNLCNETTDASSVMALNTCACLYLIHLELHQVHLNTNNRQAFETRRWGFHPPSCSATEAFPSPFLMFWWHHWHPPMSRLSPHLQPNTDSARRESSRSIRCPDLNHGQALSVSMQI